MEKICGIYCIENKINKKKYIGQSTNIIKRWKAHIVALNKKDYKVDNKYFIDDWNKYGQDNFLFYVLENCLKEELNYKESYWITTLNTLFPNGYNQTNGGIGGNTIINYSENELLEYKQKKKIIHKETALKGEDTSHSKLTNNDVLEIIKKFQNGEHDVLIAEEFNVSPRTINDIRLKRTWTSVTKDYQWEEKSNGRQLSTKNYKSVDMYTKDGEYLRSFDNARIAEEQTGVGYKLISSVCNGSKKTAKGYVWRFHNHPFDEF